MKFRRLLNSEAAGQQAKDVLSLRIAEFREELNRLQRLQDELLQLETCCCRKLSFRRPSGQYSCYLTGSRTGYNSWRKWKEAGQGCKAREKGRVPGGEGKWRNLGKGGRQRRRISWPKVLDEIAFSGCRG